MKRVRLYKQALYFAMNDYLAYEYRRRSLVAGIAYVNMDEPHPDPSKIGDIEGKTLPATKTPIGAVALGYNDDLVCFRKKYSDVVVLDDASQEDHPLDYRRLAHEFWELYKQYYQQFYGCDVELVPIEDHRPERVKNNNEPVCPVCGGPIGYFRGAPACKKCNIFHNIGESGNGLWLRIRTLEAVQLPVNRDDDEDIPF